MSPTSLTTEIHIGAVAIRLRARRTKGGWKFHANGFLLDEHPPHLPLPIKKTRYLPPPTRSHEP